MAFVRTTVSDGEGTWKANSSRDPVTIFEVRRICSEGWFGEGHVLDKNSKHETIRAKICTHPI